MNIYFIDAEPAWPFCDAGAVVIADTPEQALAQCKGLVNPTTPELIGIAAPHYTEPTVVFYNGGEY